jgi:hypothetical protein
VRLCWPHERTSKTSISSSYLLLANQIYQISYFVRHHKNNIVITRNTGTSIRPLHNPFGWRHRPDWLMLQMSWSNVKACVIFGTSRLRHMRKQTNIPEHARAIKWNKIDAFLKITASVEVAVNPVLSIKLTSANVFGTFFTRSVFTTDINATRVMVMKFAYV